MYPAGPVARRLHPLRRREPRGPKLTPETFQQGLFSYPGVRWRGERPGGRPSCSATGASSGLPYDEYSQVGLDYAVMWWNPTEVGKGKILFDDGTGKFMYIDGAKRYYAGQWKKGEPKLFDPSNSISQFDSLPSRTSCPPTRAGVPEHGTADLALESA